MIQKTYFKTKDYCKVKFTFTPEHADTVELLGLNNDWQHPIVMKKKKDGSFACEVSLPKDTQHQFKYFVDHTQWANDPDADGFAPNEFGGSNSVLTV